jgi:hypothetical protein
MKTSTTALQWGAMALAGALLLLQIVGGLEYTEGGSLFTKASMIAAMVTLAVLPAFFEAAWRRRAFGITAALLVAFVAFLAYSLPATVGRTGEIKETKATDAKLSGEARKLLADELKRAQERLDTAAKDVKTACAKAAYSDNCQGWKRTESDRQARVDKLRNEIGHAPAPKLGDTGSETWAWALSWTGITAEAIRKGSVLAFGAGLDIVIWALVWFSTSHKIAGRVSKPANDVEPRTPTTVPVPDLVETADPVIDWCRAFEAKHGRKPQIPELQAAFALPKTTAWRRINAA